MKKSITLLALSCYALFCTNQLHAQEKNTSKLREEIEYADSYSKHLFVKKKYNDNNELVAIIDNTFILKNNPKKEYNLTLKNNQPYDGYVKSEEKILGEIPIINYYEKGVLTKQYTYNYLKEEDSSHFEYDLETIFENNKIKSGYEYISLGNESVLGIAQYSNFKITSFHIDAFAMHAFARFSFELKNHKLLVSKFMDESSISITSNGKELNADFYKNNQKIETAKPAFTQVSKGTPNATVIYYSKNETELKEYAFTRNTKRLLNFIEPQNEFLFLIYTKFPHKSSLSCEDILNKLVANFKNDENFELDNLLSFIETVPFQPKEVIGYADYNEKGTIEDGIDIRNNAPFTVDFYSKGKITKTQSFPSLTEIRHDVLKE
ncbi:hypothetical protein H1R17_01700 [Flavobacterium sp. xlx-214]|uniref:hypothetical protein n=1 Tax=unclassified Flavobacterium TaxID=196869 RepID=UPI0013D55539|nr:MULTISPECIES: hypothetical protein [unclassified Flavobacterium]MBA5792736.1 hypothetical protein [Flavobacterium sp. xlx-221]QMI83873.1 hypothetical protein H1R17_01700 [Flavobacterium sp. xlx-214]